VWTGTTFSLYPLHVCTCMPVPHTHTHTHTHTLWTSLNKLCRQVDILPVYRLYFAQSCVFPQKVVILLLMADIQIIISCIHLLCS